MPPANAKERETLLTAMGGRPRYAVPPRTNSCLDYLMCTARNSESLMMWATACATMNAFWHKQLQCKSYQRQVSITAGSDRLHTLDPCLRLHDRSFLHRGFW